MTGQKRHLTRLHMERNALQRLSPTEISLADMFKANHC